MSRLGCLPVGQSRGFSFVEFLSQDDAERLIRISEVCPMVSTKLVLCNSIIVGVLVCRDKGFLFMTGEHQPATARLVTLTTECLIGRAFRYGYVVLLSVHVSSELSTVTVESMLVDMIFCLSVY